MATSSSSSSSGKREIELLLMPQPGAKPEFMAKITLEDGDDQEAENSNFSKLWWKTNLPDRLVLENYTRDAWAWKPPPSSSSSSPLLVDITCRSTDGRRKLVGFTDYLKQRQKSAFGRFPPCGIFVISYVQKKIKQDPDLVQCRLCLDLTKLPKCTIKPLQAPPQSQQQQSTATSAQSQQPAAGAPAKKKAGGGMGGLLGKLVGAQQRTNHHVISSVAAAARPKVAPKADDNAAATAADMNAAENSVVAGGPDDGGGGEAVATKTAAQVLSDFRQSMQDKMLDFDLSAEEVLKVPLQLSHYQQGLASEEDRSRVTFEILKYMVYEAAEEVNEEWIAHKEPSEFMDEAIICVYKEGAAPPEVVEEMNQGEIPDEIRGQQKHMAEERARQQQQMIAKQLQQQQKLQLKPPPGGDGDEDDDNDDGVAALNTKKRDRRTLQDFEREKREAAAKRGRSA